MLNLPRKPVCRPALRQQISLECVYRVPVFRKSELRSNVKCLASVLRKGVVHEEGTFGNGRRGNAWPRHHRSTGARASLARRILPGGGWRAYRGGGDRRNRLQRLRLRSRLRILRWLCAGILWLWRWIRAGLLRRLLRAPLFRRLRASLLWRRIRVLLWRA